MTSAEAYAELLRLGRPIIETREAAIRLSVSTSRASQLLYKLQDAGLLRQLQRGLWLLKMDIDPFVVPSYLTSPLPSYVSSWSALYRHGMIEQIPRQIFVASMDRSRRAPTFLGTYSIHHLKPEMFGGYGGSLQEGYIATPEKALFDAVYLRAPSGGRILMPELELPSGFQDKKLREWIARVSQPRLRTLVSGGIDHALSAAAKARSKA